MDLSLIFTIPGKPGLFKLVSQSKNSAIVESLLENKRLPMFNLNQVSSLAEIAIYSDQGEIELSEIFRRLHKKENGAATVHHKETFEKLKKVFEEILPDYDRERVYESNIRKVIQWYNLLIEKGLVDQELSEREKELLELEKEENADAAQQTTSATDNLQEGESEKKQAKTTKSANVKSDSSDKTPVKPTAKATKVGASKATAAKTAEKVAAKSAAKVNPKTSKAVAKDRVSAPRKAK